jgi:signal transduction histidine kinase/HAMP domain-containing protein
VKNRGRRSIISQVLLAFSVFAILIAVAAAVSYVAVEQQNSAAKQLTGRDYRLQQAAGQAQEAFTSSQIAISNYALSGRAAFLRPLVGARAFFAANVAVMRAVSPASLRGDVSAQVNAGTRLFEIAGRIAALPPGSPDARALARSVASVEGIFYPANSDMQEDVAADVRRLTKTSKDSLSTGLAWSGGALGVAVLLVLAGSLSTLGTITRPLRNLAATVRRLTSGDHAARAVVAGSAEVREVAQAVNTQADQSDRLRRQEAESNRLRAIARADGIRIREPLTIDAVIAAARTALERNVDAEIVYVHLITDGRIGPPVGHEADRILADTFDTALPSDAVAVMHELFRNQASEVIQDIQGSEGEHLPSWLLTSLRQAGVASHILMPFGIGDEMLGFIAVHRLRRRQPWSPAEIDLIESIGADLGRGINHARLYEAENRIVEDLKSLDRARSDFFATVSHELRAPLTTLEGYIEILAEGEAGPVTAEQLKMLTTVDHSTSRLRDLIDDVFMLAKLESGSMSTVTRPVGLAEIISEAVDAIHPSVAAAKLTLTTAVDDDSLIVEGDASQLDRALTNLLTNAVKFTPAGGSIDVGAWAEDSTAVVRVRDTGIGIPPADQKELFTRFFRASNARLRSIPGTGLGLAIVRNIITGHGGAVSVDSKEATGTAFTVRLPLREHR